MSIFCKQICFSNTPQFLCSVLLMPSLFGVAYIRYILFTKLGGDSCLWCFSSAFLSLGLLTFTVRSYGWGVKWNEFPMAFMPSAGVAAATVVALSFGFQNVDDSLAQEIDLPYQVRTCKESNSNKSFAVFWMYLQIGCLNHGAVLQLPEVTEESSRTAVELARRLSASGVKMFGAFWCTHCYDQKQLFGKEAMKYFPYVECYPEGYRKVGCFQSCSH